MSNIIRNAEEKDIEDIQKLNHMLFEFDYELHDKDLNVGLSFTEEAKNYFKRLVTQKTIFVDV